MTPTAVRSGAGSYITRETELCSYISSASSEIYGGESKQRRESEGAESDALKSVDGTFPTIANYGIIVL